MRAFEQRPDVRALVTTYPTSEPWLKAGDGMMRKNEIDDALHEIQQMVEVAIRGAHSLNGAEHDKQKSEMPADDAQLLDFSLLPCGRSWKNPSRRRLSSGLGATNAPDLGRLRAGTCHSFPNYGVCAFDPAIAPRHTPDGPSPSHAGAVSLSAHGRASLCA
jgi:hypothetical protein